MSHFTVLVVGPDIAAALAPFEEHAQTPIYEPTETDADLRAEYERRDDKTDSFETWMREWHGYRLNAETGKYVTTRNPKGKWDWYQLGGRWKNALRAKAGPPCDSALMSEIDFAAMREQRLGDHAKWWDECKDEKERSWRLAVSPEVTRDQYIDQANAFSTFAVVKDGQWSERGEMGWWATVSNENPDEQWRSEFGDMLGSLPPDTRISIVDCHT